MPQCHAGRRPPRGLRGLRVGADEVQRSASAQDARSTNLRTYRRAASSSAQVARSIVLLRPSCPLPRPPPPKLPAPRSNAHVDSALRVRNVVDKKLVQDFDVGPAGVSGQRQPAQLRSGKTPGMAQTTLHCRAGGGALAHLWQQRCTCANSTSENLGHCRAFEAWAATAAKRGARLWLAFQFGPDHGP